MFNNRQLNKQQLNQLYQYCYSLTADSSSAYDLLQSSLEKYLRSNQPKRVELPYIRRIIRNQFIDNYRRQQLVAFETFEEDTPIDLDGQSLEQCVINQSTLESLWGLLSANEREILYLWAVLGYSTDELAQHLDKPRGTILSNIHRTRKKIAAYIEKNEAQGRSEGSSR